MNISAAQYQSSTEQRCFAHALQYSTIIALPLSVMWEWVESSGARWYDPGTMLINTVLSQHCRKRGRARSMHQQDVLEGITMAKEGGGVEQTSGLNKYQPGTWPVGPPKAPPDVRVASGN